MDDSIVFAQWRQCEPIAILDLLYPKWHLDLFSHFAHGRESLYFTMGHFFPLRIVPSHGWIWTLSNTWFLVPPESTIQTASWLAQPFLHSWRQRVPILCNGPPPQTNRLTDRQHYSICNN